MSKCYHLYTNLQETSPKPSTTSRFNFTDLSSNSPTSWAWDFGDGNTSTLQNPTHTYAAPGFYTACVEVTKAGCNSETICAQFTLTCPAPTSTFLPSGSQQTITFTNQSQLSTSWMWDFGDGSGSTLQNPVHTYAAAGTYTVCLTAINSLRTRNFLSNQLLRIQTVLLRVGEFWCFD